MSHFAHSGFHLVLLTLCVLLQACQSKKPEPVVVPAPVQPVQLEKKPVQKPMSTPVRLLILNGEYTLARDQLLTPANDNAYNYFREALKLDPENQRAKGGLQGIVMRYVDLARQAAARGNYSTATTMLNHARIVDPENLLIKEVSEALSEQIRTAPPVESYKGGSNEFLLDANLVGKDDPQISARIVEIANKLKATNSLAIIIARTDAEGRWIYQKLREVDPDYKVRGDIKIGSPPRVKLEAIAQ
jgi:tetratricopeptide (TPR) repeat protein